MIASSIIGALEKLVLVADDCYDAASRMTCEVQQISQQIRTILVTVNSVMVNVEDLDDASMRDLEEIRLSAVRAILKLSAPANDAV